MSIKTILVLGFFAAIPANAQTIQLDFANQSAVIQAFFMKRAKAAAMTRSMDEKVIKAAMKKDSRAQILKPTIDVTVVRNEAGSMCTRWRSFVLSAKDRVGHEEAPLVRINPSACNFRVTQSFNVTKLIEMSVPQARGQSLQQTLVDICHDARLGDTPGMTIVMTADVTIKDVKVEGAAVANAFLPREGAPPQIGVRVACNPQ